MRAMGAGEGRGPLRITDCPHEEEEVVKEGLNTERETRGGEVTPSGLDPRGVVNEGSGLKFSLVAEIKGEDEDTEDVERLLERGEVFWAGLWEAGLRVRA